MNLLPQLPSLKAKVILEDIASQSNCEVLNPKGDFKVDGIFYVPTGGQIINEENLEKLRNNIDAITGETVSGGERTVSLIKIPSDKIDKGYSIRFESSVEDQKYYIQDLEFELNSENINTKIEGTGFIRYIRMISN